jgi:hypothetical protein
MPAHRKYFTDEQRRERDRLKWAKMHAKYGAPQLQALMRWYGRLSDRQILRILLGSLGLDADELLDYMIFLRKSHISNIDERHIR